MIPAIICEQLNLPADLSTEQLNTYIEENGASFLDGLLETEASRKAAFDSLPDASEYRLEAIPQLRNPREGYCEISIPDIPPIKIGMIGSPLMENIPTDLENLIFWSLMGSNLDWNLNWGNRNGANIINWREKAKGCALIAFPKQLSCYIQAKRMICAIFSLQHADLPHLHLPAPVAGTASKFLLSLNFDEYSDVQARLLFEAVNEQNPKWRFLSLYRILENAYLNNIKNIFIKEFDREPKTAVKNAEKNVSSEMMQLITLAETQGLCDEFMNFNIEFEKLIGNNNNFIKHLDQAARNDKDFYGSPQLYKKAVLRFYKLRCSIAHGGTSSVIYEQFPDASDATIQLLPSLETLALKSMKINVL